MDNDDRVENDDGSWNVLGLTTRISGVARIEVHNESENMKNISKKKSKTKDDRKGKI